MSKESNKKYHLFMQLNNFWGITSMVLAFSLEVFLITLELSLTAAIATISVGALITGASIAICAALYLKSVKKDQQLIKQHRENEKRLQALVSEIKAFDDEILKKTLGEKDESFKDIQNAEQLRNVLLERERKALNEEREDWLSQVTSTKVATPLVSALATTFGILGTLSITGMALQSNVLFFAGSATIASLGVPPLAILLVAAVLSIAIGAFVFVKVRQKMKNFDEALVDQKVVSDGVIIELQNVKMECSMECSEVKKNDQVSELQKLSAEQGKRISDLECQIRETEQSSPSEAQKGAVTGSPSNRHTPASNTPPSPLFQGRQHASSF